MAIIRIIGPAYPYRGGLAAYNERLAKELVAEGHDVKIYTFTVQYPNFLFPGKTQFSTENTSEGVDISRRVNSCNPFNWIRLGRQLRKEKADIVLFRYWIPFMAPCFGTLARIIKRNKHTKVLTIVDNLFPHEKRPLDLLLSKYFVKAMDGFIIMSKSVLNEVQSVKPRALTSFCPHPLFDNFGEKIPRNEALERLGLDPSFTYFLFFGLIRDYKGLDLLLEAFADERLREFPLKLLVAGEFYTDESVYKKLEEEKRLASFLIWHTHFIPDSEVKNYFCAADLLVQPYKSATQSGVTQIAYHFSLPMLVTDVGGLSEIAPHREVGYVVQPSPKEIADHLVEFCMRRPDFSSGLERERKKYLWSNMTRALFELYENTRESRNESGEGV